MNQHKKIFFLLGLLLIYSNIKGQPNPSCITTEIIKIVCNENGTENVADDTYFFELIIKGGTSKWIAETGLVEYTGTYNEVTTIAAIPLNNGPLFLIIRDSMNPDCLGAITIFPPTDCQSCSDQSISIIQGDTITLSTTSLISASQDSLIAFQWFKNNIAIPRATTSTLKVTEKGTYSVQANTKDSNCFFQSCCHFNVYEESSPQLIADVFFSCAGEFLKATVATNDYNLNNPSYQVVAYPQMGHLVFDQAGNFDFTPFDNTCFLDQFTYKVCNNETTYCDTTVVYLHFQDTIAPSLINVPPDITIFCDEVIPYPAIVTASDNCPNITVDIKEEISPRLDDCSQHDYTLTRIWEAKDGCNNITLDTQIINIQDKTAPDIFRIYTLPGGSKMIAGVMENVNDNWKTIAFPIDFPTTPLVFSQVITTEGTLPVRSRVNNISKTQFDLHLQMEGNESPKRESVAWIALEQGSQATPFTFEANAFHLSNSWKTFFFEENYTTSPYFFTAPQTHTSDAANYVKHQQFTTNSIQLKMEEDGLVNGIATEQFAIMSIEDNAILVEEKGSIIGEVGSMLVDETWTTVTTQNEYYNPIVLTGISTNSSDEDGIIQLRKITANSFDLRFQHKRNEVVDYIPEAVPYLIIEGSIPLDATSLCLQESNNLELGKDLIALDNCDNNIVLHYDEQELTSGTERQFIRTWYAEDVCRNATGYSQTVNCARVGLRLKALLQGAMVSNNNDGLMRDDLRRKNMIPLAQPYHYLNGYYHIGFGETEACSPDILAIEGPDAIVDWVFVELRAKDNPQQPVATTVALIQRDGDVVSPKGDTILSFDNTPSDAYYVSLRHRNHLAIISLYPYLFTTATIPFVDFTNEFTPSIGRHPTVAMKNKRALWAGDLNRDKKAIFQGPNNDIFEIFFQTITDTANETALANFISSDYTTSDYNMDGTIIYQGPMNDRASLLWNTVLKHPDNRNHHANFILSTNEKIDTSTLNLCYENPTLAFCDFDEDGIINSKDADDDNDGVIDGNDIAPYNIHSDSDEDGISDNTETGSNGIYQEMLDSDPLNPCDPFQNSNACSGIDEDGDGLYQNYPKNHPLYDTDDANNCPPPYTSSLCDCPDEDDNGYIEICHLKDGHRQTISIPLKEWKVRKRLGDFCGSCNR